jgi:monoamine oxidase
LSKTGGSGIKPVLLCFFPIRPVGSQGSGVILASYTWADDANRWDSIPDDDRYRFALEGLMNIYGPEIQRYFTGHGQIQSWMEDFYAFGEAAVFTPGQVTELHPYIPVPEGPVYFAGEHTSFKHTWIKGAIESAIRAALEIHQLVAA